MLNIQAVSAHRLLLVLGLFLCMLRGASGAIVYTYTSPTFDGDRLFDPWCSEPQCDHITASFAVKDPFAPNQSLHVDNAQVLYWRISDGVRFLSGDSAKPPVTPSTGFPSIDIMVQTGADGMIINGAMLVIHNPGRGMEWTFGASPSRSLTQEIHEKADGFGFTGHQSVTTSPGVWTSAVGPDVLPEPASLTMMSLGFAALGFGLVARRSRARR